MSLAQTVSFIMGFDKFKTRLDELEKESLNKDGTANGVNHEVEYLGNVANAVVFTATDIFTEKYLEEFLKMYADDMNMSDSLADYTGDSIGNRIKEELYNSNRNKFESFKENNLNLVTVNDIAKEEFLDTEYRLRNEGLLSSNAYYEVADILKSDIGSTSQYSQYSDMYYDNFIAPIIGAFYESTSNPKNDKSSSIADKTGVLLTSNNQKISEGELLQLDINSDGKLTSAELSSLNLWTELTPYHLNIVVNNADALNKKHLEMGTFILISFKLAS